jgi:bifunctional non-homologous end joining protein LigD
VRSCLIDGEAVACDGDGMPVFDRLRYRRQDGRVFLYAFDLLELNGQDLRREPIEIRKRQLATLLRAAQVGLQLNEHISEPGDVVFRHASRWVSRASFRSGSARATAPAARPTGSR